MTIRVSSLVNMPPSLLAITLSLTMLEIAVTNSVLSSTGRLIGKPCVRADPLTKNIPMNERWLKSAQLFAFCFEKYGTASGRNSSIQEKVCETRECKSCLYVCTLKRYVDEADCWRQCSTHSHSDVCKRGCSFYLTIHGKNSTEAFNLSTSAAPSTLIVPRIATPSYEYTEVMWNQSSSASLIVYVIFSRVHYTKKTDVGEFQPTNLTMDSKKSITITNICAYHHSADHHLGVKFAYDVAAVSMHGYNKSTFFSTSKVLIEKGFKKVDYITNISIPNPGVLNTKTHIPSVTYRVDWNVNKGIAHHVTHVEVSDKLSGCGFHVSTDHPETAYPPSQTVNQVVHLRNINKECNITFKVLPYFDCLEGVPKTRTILYRGCHNFSNAPPECKKPTVVAPTNLPAVIANMTITKYMCRKYADRNCSIKGKSSFCRCDDGTYNVIFRWNVPDAGKLKYYGIKCALYELVRASPMWSYPMLNINRILDKDARNFSIEGLSFRKKYSFKVHLRKSAEEDKLMTTVTGLDFNITGVPIKLPSSLPGPISPTHVVQPTTLTSVKNRIISKSNEKSLPLTAGLILAFIAIFIIIFVLIIAYKRKKRLTTQLGFDDLGQVSFRVDPPDHWELLLDNIIFGEAIGEGAFGKVYCATVSGINLQNTFGSSESLESYVKMGPNRTATPTGSFITKKAAVKLLQDNFTAQHKSDFLEEINLMKNVGHHKNIVNMLGCVTRGPTLCLVVEYMSNGDLLNYLRRRRSQILGMPVYVNTSLSLSKYIQCEVFARRSTSNLVPSSNTENEMVASDLNCEGEHPGDNDAISADDLLRISWQVASGMEFLAQKGYVHRDLAARNVLVGPNKLCKISDFGLTRFVYEEKVYVSRKTRKLPIKWMSIEAIVDQRFTTFSDVWSFGVLLFEVVTLGGTPYPTMTGQELLRFLRAGNRMSKPDNCSNEIFTVMKACWLTDPLSRPTFTDIKERFEMLISKGTPYVEFDIDSTNPYYNVPSFMSIGDSDCASLADDMEEGEAELENRFRSFEHGVAGSLSDRYTAGNEKKHWLSTSAIEEERRKRAQLDSASSDVSTTPLAHGIRDINLLALSVPLDCTSAHVPGQYEWQNDEALSREKNGFSQSEGAVFTVDHYVNFNP